MLLWMSPPLCLSCAWDMHMKPKTHTPTTPHTLGKAVSVASHKSELWLTLCITEVHEIHGNCTLRQRAACCPLRQCNLSYVRIVCGQKQCLVEQGDEYFSLCPTMAPVPLCIGNCPALFYSSFWVWWGVCGISMSWGCFGVLLWKHVRRACCTWPLHVSWHGSYTVPSHQLEEPSPLMEKQRCTTCFSAGTTLFESVDPSIKYHIDCISII